LVNNELESIEKKSAMVSMRGLKGTTKTSVTLVDILIHVGSTNN
jgi:hypothetical protein